MKQIKTLVSKTNFNQMHPKWWQHDFSGLQPIPHITPKRHNRSWTAAFEARIETRPYDINVPRERLENSAFLYVISFNISFKSFSIDSSSFLKRTLCYSLKFIVKVFGVNFTPTQQVAVMSAECFITTHGGAPQEEELVCVRLIAAVLL